MFDRPRFQSVLNETRDELPKLEVLNTVFFSIPGAPRYDCMSSNGKKIYRVPVTIDRVELSDGRERVSFGGGAREAATPDG